jgi:hypothetical protein
MPALTLLKQLEPQLRPRVWQALVAGQAEGDASEVVPSGFAALDRVLPGGGWPARALIELLGARGICELRLLLPVLAQRTQAGAPVMLIAPPLVPYAPALAAQGLRLEQLLLVQAPERGACLWSIEQALKSGSLSALLAWLPEEGRDGRQGRAGGSSFDALRRLQLAAQQMPADGLVFLLRSPAARDSASPAPLRIALSPHRRGITLDLFKRRGQPLAAPVTLDLPAPRLRRRASLVDDLPVTASAAAAAAVADLHTSLRDAAAA